MNDPTRTYATWRYLALAGAAIAAALGGCDNGGAFPDVCRIDYRLVLGEPSSRFDLLFVEDDGTVVRAIHDEGGNRPNRAIYYGFDNGRLIVEALDDRANGDIEARLDAAAPLGDDIVPYWVDTDLQDGAVDAIQLSIDLPTSRIGTWNPARMFYTVPCDQGSASTRDIADGRSEILLDAGDDGTPDTIMRVQRTDDGVIQGWLIDSDADGTTDDIATVRYNDDGLAEEIVWTRPGLVLGEIYAAATFVYDTDGNLYAYQLDDDGDDVVDTEITYSSACWAQEGSR